MNEKLIEKKLREKVKSLGGIAAFAEIKTTGKKPTMLQEKAIAELQALGFKAEVIDSQERLNKFLEELRNE